jgi:chromosome segregation ATPase
MSKNMYDMKLAKYKAKLLGLENNPNKRQIYLKKIHEYSSMVKKIGQSGGADELEELKQKFTNLHDKIPKVDGVLNKANTIISNSAKAKEEHEKLIQKFIDEIKRLHKAKNDALKQLADDHNARIKELEDEIAAKDLEIERLKKELEDARAPKPGLPNPPIVINIDDNPIVIQLRKTIITLEQEKHDLQEALNEMTTKYDKLVEDFNKYKRLVEEQILLLGGELDSLKTESDRISEAINGADTVVPEDADVRYPKIMYEIALGEAVDAIKIIPNPRNTPFPEATLEIKDIVERLNVAKGPKSIDAVRRELKAKLTEVNNDDRFNGLVNKYVV